MNYPKSSHKRLILPYYVAVSDRNDPGSISILCRTFATEIGSNFMLEILPMMNLLNQSEKLFHFVFWGEKSFVTIHLSG